MDSSVSQKDQFWFLRVCLHVPIQLYHLVAAAKFKTSDETVTETLKTCCCQIEEWFCANPGQLVTVCQIGELYGDALSRIATGDVADNGLRATGLLLYVGSIFMPHDSVWPQRTQIMPSTFVKPVTA